MMKGKVVVEFESKEELENLLKLLLGKVEVKTGMPEPKAEVEAELKKVEPKAKEEVKVGEEKAEYEPEPEQEEPVEEEAEDCFGNYDPNDPACKQCGIAKDCKAVTKTKAQPEKEVKQEPSKPIPDISGAPTLKEAVKMLLQAGIKNEEEICQIIEDAEGELEFTLPANWKEKVKRLVILLG